MLSRVQRAFVRLVRPVSETPSQLPPEIEKEPSRSPVLRVVRPNEQEPERQEHPPAPESAGEPSVQGQQEAAAEEPNPATEGSESRAQSRGSTEWWMGVVHEQQKLQEELQLERGKRQYRGSKVARKGFRFTPGTLLNRKAE